MNNRDIPIWQRLISNGYETYAKQNIYLRKLILVGGLITIFVFLTTVLLVIQWLFDSKLSNTDIAILFDNLRETSNAHTAYPLHRVSKSHEFPPFYMIFNKYMNLPTIRDLFCALCFSLFVGIMISVPINTSEIIE